MAEQITLTHIEDLARRLCYEADPGAIWPAIDECERLHWRRQSQQKLAAKLYENTDSRITL